MSRKVFIVIIEYKLTWKFGRGNTKIVPSSAMIRPLPLQEKTLFFSDDYMKI